ncbi:hypothetical protein NM688_g6584 [Phlebia brevispora]|uniref:Uncharacterized protein n=1 Tax=Phlebia brevispora TaxID=194682 RepID=A0ACC1SEC7_9APHY|nr:hypothetical protein NM688_g6584 [Phlebia brevispora]
MDDDLNSHAHVGSVLKESQEVGDDGEALAIGGAGRLNYDLLYCIFEHIFSPNESDILNPALSRGPDSPWCGALRMKKALTLVSRSWNFPAVEFLYRDIAIRRPGQLVPLQEALERKPEYGAMIQCLRLDCYVPKAMNKIVGCCLPAILERCPNLRSLGLGNFFIVTYLQDVTWLPGPAEGRDVDASISSLLQKGSMLKNLSFVVHEYTNVKPYRLPLPLLEAATHLLSLTLSVSDLHEGSKVMTFPALQELRLSVTAAPAAAAENVASCFRNLTQWALPALTHLWLTECPEYPQNIHMSYCRAFQRVVEAHGSGLVFLDLSRCIGPFPFTYDLTKFCPRLRHLVLSGSTHKKVYWPNITSSTLHIDVWVRHHCSTVDSFRLEFKRGNRDKNWYASSAIRGDRVWSRRLAQRVGCGTIRFLSWSLRSLPYLPTAFPPRQDTSSQCTSVFYDGALRYLPAPRLHDVFGKRIAECDSGIILEEEYVHGGEGWDLTEETLDSESEYESDSDWYSNSGSLEEGELSGSSSDEGVGP